jgi:hypothetical protein
MNSREGCPPVAPNARRWAAAGTIPETWVTLHSGDIGNSFGPKDYRSARVCRSHCRSTQDHSTPHYFRRSPRRAELPVWEHSGTIVVRPLRSLRGAKYPPLACRCSGPGGAPDRNPQPAASTVRVLRVEQFGREPFGLSTMRPVAIEDDRADLLPQLKSRLRERVSPDRRVHSDWR